MDPRVDALLDEAGGAASRAELLRVVSRATLDDEVRRRLLSAVFPRAYARPWSVDDPSVRLRAALASTGGDVALSHVTALEQWELLPVQDGPIHVTAYNPRHPRGVAGELVVHRTLLPLGALNLNGMTTVRPELAALTSWPLLGERERRAPIIEGSRRKLFDTRRLADGAERMWWIRDLPALRELVAQIAAGCESELELWGYTDVFNVPGLDDASRQVIVEVDGETYRLDVAYDEEMLAIELDGRKYHASSKQWERDIRRDRKVATLGWQTIRYSHDQLRFDVEGCRRDTLAIRRARRRLAS
ncbi:MAG TPA: DUF559 domain-containing protein [Jatrophihabitans sp.]|jgi:hypothetical protein